MAISALSAVIVPLVVSIVTLPFSERIDFAVAMAYTRDDKLLRYQLHALHGGIGGARVWLGLGTWLFTSEPARIADQIALAREVAPPGIVLFSYDALAAKPSALEALSRK